MADAGASDAYYNLTSVIFHALQGGHTYQQYIDDAQREGHEQLADFFRHVQEEDRNRAVQGQQQLDQLFHETSPSSGQVGAV